MNNNMYIAVDQYNQTYHIATNHPRKWLPEYLGSKRADKMFRDTKDGSKHVGYVIKGLWLEIFKISAWKIN
jgi:hypothetical protein